MPGTLRGGEPVATIDLLAAPSASAWCRRGSVTSTLLPPARRAVPLIQSILFFLNSISMPPVRPATILSLRAWTAGMSMPDGAGIDAGQAPFLRRLRDLQRMRVLEQRLGGDAAPDEARAAQRLLLLDDRHLQPQLRRANGRDVAAGARADDDDVVLVGQRKLLAHTAFLGTRVRSDQPLTVAWNARTASRRRA